MKIWFLWAWMVGVAWAQELSWDNSKWTPLLQPCESCREDKKLNIRQANLEQLSFKNLPAQQQKSIYPLKSTSIPKLDNALAKDQNTAAQTTNVQAKHSSVQQQIFEQQQRAANQKQDVKIIPANIQQQIFNQQQQRAANQRQSNNIIPANVHQQQIFNQQQQRAANQKQSTNIIPAVPFHRSSVQQQIFDQQQKAAKQKQNTKVFPVPLVHSEQVLHPFKQIEFSDKVKRDQDSRVILGGSPNAFTNTLPMTLVTAKGQEADARAKLSLLEAALTSPHPNHQPDGHLPRIFIAPSHVPAPPGYVKIALVPQADAASQPRDSLPQTFLTPNAFNLSPDLIKLDLPHSVSHLSRDIPVVVPNDQIAPNPLGLPHLNPLVPRPNASLNIQALGDIRQAKAISPRSPTVQVLPRGEPSIISHPQTTSRLPPPPPTSQTARPTPTFRPTPTTPRATARPPPPPPQFSRPPPQFQQQQRFPNAPSPFAPRPPFTAFPGAPIPGQHFNGPPRFIPGQHQQFQGQGFPQPASQFRPGQPFPSAGQPFRAPAQPFQAPAQPFQAPAQPFQAPAQPFQAPARPIHGAPQQFPGFPQQFPQNFNGAPIQFGQPPNQFRPENNVFRNPNPTFRPDFPQISEITPRPIPVTTPRTTPTKKVSPTTATTPKPTPKLTTLRPVPITSQRPVPTFTPRIPVTSPRPVPTSTPRILSVTPALRPTPKAFEAASPNPQIFSQGSPKPQFSSTPFRPNPSAQSTPRPFPPSPFPSSPFPSTPFPSSPFPQTSTPGPLPPRPAPRTSPFTFQPTPSPVPFSTPFSPRSPVIPGFQQPQRPRFPSFQEAQNARIPSVVETKRPTTTVETQRPRIPSFQVPRKPFQPLFTEPKTPEIGKSASPEVLEAERAGFQSIETSVPTLVNSEKPLIPSFQRPRIQTLKPVKVRKSPVTTSPEPSTTTTTTTTTVTTPKPTTPSTTPEDKATTFKPRIRTIGGIRRPFIRRKPIKRIKKPTVVVEDGVKPENEKKNESSTIFPSFAVANRMNQLRKKEALGGAVEDTKLGIPPRGTFGRRIRPRTRSPNAVTSTGPKSRSEPVNGQRLRPWLAQRRRARLTTTTQETPVDDVLENDTPVDILDDNEFRGAESALVVVSRQPAENSAFNYREQAKTLQEKEKVLRNEQVSVAIKAAEDALLHYADVVEEEAIIEKDVSAIETLIHYEPVPEVDDEYDVYEPEPEPEVAVSEPEPEPTFYDDEYEEDLVSEPEPEPTFYDDEYEEDLELVTVAIPSAEVIEEKSASPEPEPNTEYVDQYFDYENSLEDTVTTISPFIDDLKHIPSSKPHLPYYTPVEISLDSHRSDIPIESSLEPEPEPEYAPVEHDDTFAPSSDIIDDQYTLLEVDSATDSPFDDVTGKPLLFDTQPQNLVKDYGDYYEYDDYVDSTGDGSDQSFGGSVSQVIYAVPASDWRPDDAAISKDSSFASSGKSLVGVTEDSLRNSDSSLVSTVSLPASSNVYQGVTDQESPKVIDPPADEFPVTTETYLGVDEASFLNTEAPEDLFQFDESFFDDMMTTIIPETIPETTWGSFSVKPITITPPTSTTASSLPKENDLNKGNKVEMKWSVRGPKILSHSTITESRTSNARVCFADGTCFDASGIKRRRK